MMPNSRLEESEIQTLSKSSGLEASDSCCEPVERLEIIAGEQSGASIDIQNKVSFSVGTDFSNDVVLRSVQANPLKLQIELHQGKRLIQLLEGQVFIEGTDLLAGEWYELDMGMPVTFAEVSFRIQGVPAIEQLHDDEAATAVAVTSKKRTTAAFALITGIAVLGFLGLQDYWLANAGKPAPIPTLEQRIAELGLNDLQVVEADSDDGGLVVQGRVSNRNELRSLQQLLTADTQSASLDVQVDSDMVDGLTDIYRNHGITAEVEVLGKGHVRVETDGVDEQTMTAIETVLQTDLPMLHKLDIANTPPEVESEPVTTPVDPEKEIEAVVAGDISYVITRDKARYFVGAVLPSGHTIKSIEEGTIVMLLAGEEIQLKF